jgi:CubicO group peptidase (beta-lactamase class C family)
MPHLKTILRFVFPFVLCAAPAAGLQSQASRLDSLDRYVREQMARRRISGASLAIIQDGRIVAARAYGVVDETTRAPVTTATLFQAGSISKPVAALGALHLVEAGRLSLDGDVNAKLTTWKVPDNTFTTTEKVTLRRLLSHSAGVTVHGFPGYDPAEPVPSLVQVLDGAPPTNTRPIRVDTTPGAISRYSGGGFTIMQQMMIDVSGTPFPQFMQETVLAPIGMTSSSFEQPQPAPRAALTATGYYADRSPVRGRWHVYPEMAAAGLWTTATDLARFAIEIQETLAGRGGGHGVISSAMARQYLTVQKGSSGLGIALRGSGDTLSFSHGGRDEGFDAQLVAFAVSGQGAVIMINANDNSRFMGRILDFIGRAYGWPEGGSAPAVVRAERVEPARLARYAGYNEFFENQMITVVPNQAGTGLETLVDGFPDDEYLGIDSVRFGSGERGVRIAFTLDPRGAVTGVVWRAGEGPPRERAVARVAPLPSTQTPTPDPDAALTTRIAAALQAMRQGGAALADAPNITSGTKQDFSGGIGTALDGLGPLTYLGLEDVSGRGIRRHGGNVARVRYYQVTTTAGQRYLFVHLTADGIVTDFDVVER